jgi:hypothetical protein
MKKALIALAVIIPATLASYSYKVNEDHKANEAKLIKEFEAQEFENERRINMVAHLYTIKLDYKSSGLDVTKIDHEIDSISMLIK